MAFQPALAPLVGLAAGIVLGAFGAFLAFASGRRRAALGVALTAIGVGLIGAGQSLRAMNDADDARELAFIAILLLGLVAMGIGAFTLWVTFPTRPHRRERRALVLAALAIVPLLALAVSPPGLRGAPIPVRLVFGLGIPAFAGFCGILLLLALRHRTADTASERRDMRLATIALTPYFAGNISDWMMGSALPAELIIGAMSVAICVLIAAAWIVAARGPDGRAARNMAFLGPGVILAMALAVAFASDRADMERFLPAASRVWAVVVLGYAILRHQMLGLDVRVRWTIDRGTLVAAFAAVFLVATRVAEAYLETYGWLVGGVAAGLLVFALPRLQRVASRVADAAVPHAKAASAMSETERRELYAEQARIAWRDGAMSRREREMLRRLQERLGIGPDEATRIEDEAAGAA